MNMKNIFAKIISLNIILLMLGMLAMPIIANAASTTDSAKKQVLKTVEDIEKYIDESKYPGFKAKLVALKKANPNWNFTVYYTGIAWEKALYNETKGLHGRSLVQGKTGEWLCEVCRH